MNTAENSRAAMGGENAPGAMYAVAAPMIARPQPFGLLELPGGSLPVDDILGWMNETCESWNSRTADEKFFLSRDYLQNNNTTGGIYDAATLNWWADWYRTQINEECARRGYRQASDTAANGPYGKAPSPYVAIGTSIKAPGEVSAGFSFSLPELLVGGVIGAVVAKWLL